MKAVILAAGKSTRMKSLAHDRPKAMIELGKRRMLERILLAIAGAGIDEFIVVTGHFASLIEDHFGDGGGHGFTIKYVRQETPDGTGSAVHLTKAAVGGESILLTYGDIITSPENYPALVDTFTETRCDALLAVQHVDDPHRGAAIYVDESGHVERIVEKPPPGTSLTNWNNAGLYICSSRIYEYTAKLTPSPRGEYELTDALIAMIEDGLAVRAQPLTGYWGDVGTPEDVERIRSILEGEESRP